MESTTCSKNVPTSNSELVGHIWMSPKSSMGLQSEGNIGLEKRDCIYLVTALSKLCT